MGEIRVKEGLDSLVAAGSVDKGVPEKVKVEKVCIEVKVSPPRF